ncbi:MAG: hypothetical protein PHV51_03995, partial [Methanosarcinaceae archaeon]|nr:hypothetical protein [Methanosarcinaceae archaeon]
MHSGTHTLYVICKEEKSGRTLTYSKTLQVKGIEYELEMEAQSLKPGEMIRATINNTGGVALSGSYDLELSDGNDIKANTSGNVVSLASGNTKILSLEVPKLNSGTYQLTLSFEDQGGEEESKYVSVYIPDPSFDLSLNRSDYRQGDTIGAHLGNISGINNGNFTLKLFDEQNNMVASSRSNEDASSKSVDLELGIPEGIFSGRYVFSVDVKDLGSELGNSTSTAIPIEGISMTPEIRVERTEYLENDTINYTALFHCTGELPGGNASIRAYLQESSAASRDLALYSKYPVTSVVRLGDRVFLGTNGGLYEDTGNGEVEPVDNTKLASMKISSLDTSGGLLWVLNEYTVYSYNPATGELIEVLVVEKEEGEFYEFQEEGPGAGTIKVDAAGQKVYLVNWNEVKEYNFGEGTPAATYNSTNSPISDNSNLDDVLVLPNELLFIAWDYSTEIGVRNSECYSLLASGWNQYNSSSGLSSDNVLAVVSDESYVYFITDAGISRRAAAGGSISTLYEFKEGESPSMVDTANAFNGVVLLYSDRKLYRYTASGTLDIFTIFEEGADLSGLAQGSSAVWLCGYNGLFAFNETGDPGIRQVPINSFGANGIIAGDSTCIVSASGKFLSIYEPRSDLWTEMEVGAASGISAAALTSGYIWLAAGEDLLCIDKNTKEISIFNASNSGYEESGSLRLESHNEDLWVLNDSGVSVYGTSGGISSTVLNVPEVRSPKAFTASGDLVAIIDSSGVIHEYDYGLDTVQHYGTGVSSGYSYKLAYSGGVYWILHNGLFSYDSETGIMEQYEEIQGFYSLVSSGDTLYALSWGDYMGNKVNFFDGEAWKELTTDLVPENSWISGMERGQGTVLIYDSYSGWIVSLSGEKMQLVFDEPVNLDKFSGAGTTFSWAGSYVAEKEGQLTFELSAVTDYHQLTDSDSGSVDVYARDFSLAIATDKEYYRPDETFNVNGLVSNNAPAPLLGELVLLGDGTEFKRISLDVAPSETESFELPAPDFALGTHTLAARIGSTVVSREILIESPQVQVNLTAPELVDSKPFIIGLTATNPGNVTAEVGVEVNNLSLNTRNFTISLAPGTSRALEFNTTVRENTTIGVNITGDLTEHLTKFIEFGEKASIASESLVMYRPGKVEIPLNISNTGKYNTGFTATFAVNETLNETRTYKLGLNQSVNDTLVFTLGKGNYSLEVTGDIPLEFAECPFTVDRTVSLNLSELKMLPGNLSVCANVSNLHPQLPFNGSLEISSDFFEQAYIVNLTALENSSLEYRIPLLDL